MSKLHEARVEAQTRKAINDAHFSAEMAKLNQARAIARESFLREKEALGLRETTLDEYRHWLSGYLENGGRVSHYYDYEFGRQTFYTATYSGSLAPQYGSASFCVLAPAGVKIVSGGHNNVFHIDGFTASGWFAPMFDNV